MTRSPEYHDQTFITPDGIGLHLREYAREDGNGVADDGAASTGPSVICLHGLTRNVLDFDELAPKIAGLGRRVVCVSQRGRGQSQWDRVAERYVLPTYVGDTLALLDHLAIEGAVFIGTSMGGLMTMMLAQHAPERVAGAVLNDIGPVIDPAGLARIAGYVGDVSPARSWADAAARCKAVHAVAFLGQTEAFWMQFARRTHRETDAGEVIGDYDPAIASTLAQAPGPVVDWWAAFEALFDAPFESLFDSLGHVPVLSVRGGLSDILSAQTVADMVARRPGLATVTTKDVGHAPYMTEPDTWPTIAALIRETGVGSSVG